MGQFDQAPQPQGSLWDHPPGQGAELTPDQLAHAAVLEQMAHGSTYGGGHTDGNVVSHDQGEVDRREMLEHNGYDPEPQLISGREGLQMVVYRPLPGRDDVQPVVSFRGTEEGRDVESDFDPHQVGNDQYEANRALIDQTMREVAEESGRPVEVTGHSLGGGLAQIAAAHNPHATGHITTFQASGVDREEVDRIEEYNRQRSAAGLLPLEATHFRVENDIVPLAGEGLAPGQMHQMEIDTPDVNIPHVGNVDLPTDPYSAHTSHPVTALAMRTGEGREALPGIPMPRETVEEVDSHDVSVENNGTHRAEIARSAAGHVMRAVQAVGRGVVDARDRAVNAGNHAVASGQRAVDSGQANVDRTVRSGQGQVDAAQRRAGAAVNRGQTAVDSGQRNVQQAVSRGQGTVDRAQRALGGALPAQAHQAIDASQRVVGNTVAAGQRAVDTGQRAVSNTVAAGQRAVNTGQRAVNRAVASGQRAVDAGQRAAGAMWHWIAD